MAILQPTQIKRRESPISTPISRPRIQDTGLINSYLRIHRQEQLPAGPPVPLGKQNADEDGKVDGHRILDLPMIDSIDRCRAPKSASVLIEMRRTFASQLPVFVGVLFSQRNGGPAEAVPEDGLLR